VISAYYMQDLNNLSQFRKPSFTKSDITLTYTAEDRRYFVQGFAKNLEDNVTIAAAASGLLSGVNIEEPRIYGLPVGFSL
jgi:iron complex outermembrane receptor protein